MHSFFRNRPLHLLLLPLCFAAYALSIHFGRATVRDALLVALAAGGGLLLLLGLLRLLLKKPLAAALLATTTATVFLYWAYPYTRIKALGGAARWASLPVLLLGTALLLLAAGFFFARAQESLRRRINLFFNLLFGVLLCYNSSVYLQRIATAPALLEAAPKPSPGMGTAPVFILLFDELWNLNQLAAAGFPTSGIDTFLRQEGFYLARHSCSNYPMTHFSLASALNESYLRFANGETVDFRDYNAAQVCIRNSVFVKSFLQSGYQLRNRSVFALAGTPSFGTDAALKEGPSALLSGTLGGAVLWPVWQKKFFPQQIADRWFSGKKRHAALLQAIAEDARTQQPVLCYAHFFAPHTPYYFDPEGRPLSLDSSLAWSARNDPRGYSGNVREALAYLRQAVSTIRHNCPQAIILLLSDHGYRNAAFPGNDTAQFQNVCAVYYPDQDYRGWTPNTSMVNAFRLLHNKTLGTTLPLLPDRTVLLHDATGLEW